MRPEGQFAKQRLQREYSIKLLRIKEETYILGKIVWVAVDIVNGQWEFVTSHCRSMPRR